jgi:hypothetical protein
MIMIDTNTHDTSVSLEEVLFVRIAYEFLKM